MSPFIHLLFSKMEDNYIINTTISYYQLSNKYINKILSLPDEDPLLSDLVDYKNVPLNLCCPISLELIRDPIKTSDGFTYDRKSLELYFESCCNRNTIACSPLTRASFTSFERNYDLREDIKEFIKEQESL